MADIGKSVRNILLSGVKAVNSAANSIANSTRQKVDEMNLNNQRRELMDKVAACVYEMWRSGAELPEEISSMLAEIGKADEMLSAMRDTKNEETADTAADQEIPGEVVLNVPDEGPYAEAAEQAKEEDSFREQVKELVEDVKEAVEKTKDAVEDLLDDDEQ